jgi:hypothetical protein
MPIANPKPATISRSLAASIAIGTMAGGTPRAIISFAGIAWLMIPNPFKRKTIDIRIRADMTKYWL